jgi:hypothetical protein
MMKKLIKRSFLTLLVATLLTPSSALGARHVREVPEENFAYIDDDERYWAKFVPHHPDYVFDLFAGKKLGDYSVSGFLIYDEQMVATEVEWVDPLQVIEEGSQIVRIKANHNGKEIILSGEIIGIKPDEPTVPSLTATMVTLESRTAYDINLNDKISGSKYRWTSSNPDIVEVNAKNGKIKAIKPGKSTITCEITLPDGKVQKLTSIVSVGYDENAPVLTETVLDLEVGDKFDINLENKIAKSKYRWVSSNRKVVKVNSANGKVTAVGAGEAYVTCTITTPENQVIVLRCDINVTE